MAQFNYRARVKMQHVSIGGEVVVEEVAPLAEACIVDEQIDGQAQLNHLLEQTLAGTFRAEVRCNDLNCYMIIRTKLGRQVVQAVFRSRHQNEI